MTNRVPGIVRTQVLFAFVFVSAALQGQNSAPKDFVIEGVYLALEQAGGRPVNILVRDNRLKMVSPDSIPVSDEITRLDAAGGHLIGRLTLGEEPDFIILPTDPQEDLAPLTNTRLYATYIIHDGSLIKNDLAVVDADEVAVAVASHPVWQAYTPPPVALPTSYDAGESWNHWNTENSRNVFFGVIALDRQYWLSQDRRSRQQVGSLDDFEGGEIRDLRLGLFGTLGFFDRPWGYSLVAATNAFDKEFEEGSQNNFRAIDYRLDIPLGSSLQLSLGKQKEPISMERTMTLVNLPMQERTAGADAFLPSRNFGAQLSGNALDQRLSWAGGVFNNFIEEDSSISDGATSVGGRVTWLPLASTDKSNLLHVAAALRHTDGGPPVRYRTEPEFNKSPLFIDTGEFEVDSVDQLSLEASWRRGPFWLAAEHLTTRADSLAFGTLDFEGYYLTASMIVTGEMRRYDTGNGTFGAVPVSRPARGSDVGAWELSTRWSSTDLNDGPIQGGRLEIISLSTSWWLTSTANASLNYRYIFNDNDGLSGESSGLNIRLLLKLN